MAKHFVSKAHGRRVQLQIQKEIEFQARVQAAKEKPSAPAPPTAPTQPPASKPNRLCSNKI
jgi:hypothetical protein